ILEFKKKGATVILSTHRMESVEELCDHIALIHRSQKILEGPVSEIQKQFKKESYVVEGNGKLTGSDLIKIISEERLPDGKTRLHLKSIKNRTSNEVLKEVMKSMEICSFKEEVPSMH